MNLPAFAQPAWLLLLAFVPLWWAWYMGVYRPVQPVVRTAANLSGPYRWQFPWHWLPTVLFQLGLAAWVGALARPQMQATVVEEELHGSNLVFALDISHSMASTDAPPTRLRAANYIANQLLGALDHDRVGLVAFAEGAYTVAPLTLDHPHIRRQLEELETGILPDEGTALGDAVALGLHRLALAPRGTRAVVVFSDGAANLGRLGPLDAAALARQRRIPVHTVAVGNPDNAAANREPENELDFQTLRQLADTTGGLFARGDSPQALRQLQKQLGALARASIGRTTRTIVSEQYPTYGLVGLGLLILSLVARGLGLGNPLEG